MNDHINQLSVTGAAREWVRFGAKEVCYIEKIGALLEEWVHEPVGDDSTLGRRAFVCALLDGDRKHRVASCFATSAFVKCSLDELKELEKKVTAIDDRISLKKLQGNFEVAEMECYRDSTVQNLLWTITTKDRAKITITDNSRCCDFCLNEEDGKHPTLLREGKVRHVTPVFFHPNNSDKLVLKGYLEKIQGKGKENCLYLILPCNYCACIVVPKKDVRLTVPDMAGRRAFSDKVEWMMLRGVGKKQMEGVKRYLKKWVTKADSGQENAIEEVFEATYTATTLSKASGQKVRKTVAVMPGMLLLKCSEKMLCETIREDIMSRDSHGWRELGLEDNYLYRHIFRNKEKRPIHTTDKAIAAFKQALTDFDKMTRMDPMEKLKSGWVRVCDETSPFYMLVGKLAECRHKVDKEAGWCNFVIAACYELMTDKFCVKMRLTDLEAYSDAEYEAIEKQIKKAKRRKK